MMPTAHIITLVGLGGALMGCTQRSESAPRIEPNDPSTDTVSLAERDSGRVVQIASGVTVVIRLGSNRSTGYSWTLAPSSAGVLTALGGPVYTSGTAASGSVGSGGVEAWSFLASLSGRQELRFEYRRPWERDTAPARALHYTIAVR